MQLQGWGFRAQWRARVVAERLTIVAAVHAADGGAGAHGSSRSCRQLGHERRQLVRQEHPKLPVLARQHERGRDADRDRQYRDERGELHHAKGEQQATR